MLNRVEALPAQQLDRATYHEQLQTYWNDIEDTFWKLERAQVFSEPGNESWLAWRNGDWAEAMRLIETKRPGLVERYQRVKALGFAARRIRVVERPFSPYIQWELNSLRVREESGEQIRVLDAAELGDRETHGPLPEIVILGTNAMFQVLYDETGAGAGARKFSDQELIRACRAELAQLWDQAEDLIPFLERDVLHLPPPVPNAG